MVGGEKTNPDGDSKRRKKKTPMEIREWIGERRDVLFRKGGERIVETFTIIENSLTKKRSYRLCKSRGGDFRPRLSPGAAVEVVIPQQLSEEAISEVRNLAKPLRRKGVRYSSP